MQLVYLIAVPCHAVNVLVYAPLSIVCRQCFCGWHSSLFHWALFVFWWAIYTFMVGDRICTPQIAATIEIAANFFQINRALHLSFAFAFAFRTLKSDLLSIFGPLNKVNMHTMVLEKWFYTNQFYGPKLHNAPQWLERFCFIAAEKYKDICPLEKLRLEINK